MTPAELFEHARTDLQIASMRPEFQGLTSSEVGIIVHDDPAGTRGQLVRRDRAKDALAGIGVPDRAVEVILATATRCGTPVLFLSADSWMHGEAEWSPRAAG